MHLLKPQSLPTYVALGLSLVHLGLAQNPFATGNTGNSNSGGGSIRTCPTVRLTQEKQDARVVDQPRCSDDDGDMFMADDGSYYRLACCSHGPGREIERTVESSFLACSNKCSATSDCLGFVYSAKPNHENVLGTCKLYDAGRFPEKKCGDDTHDYAYLVPPLVIESPDRPNILCSTECPAADGMPYTSKRGEIFHIDCGMRHGTKVIHEDTQPTFKDCLDACSLLLPCHSVDYHVNSHKCYYGNHHGEPTISASGFQSGHTLGCSGACDGGSCCGGSGSEPALELQTPGQNTPEVPPTQSSEQPEVVPDPQVNCQADDNKEVTIEGKTYRIRCNKQHSDGWYGNQQADSFTECLKLCSNDNNCKSIDFWDPNGVKGCYFFSKTSEPAHVNDMCWAAIPA